MTILKLIFLDLARIVISKLVKIWSVVFDGRRLDIKHVNNILPPS